MKISIVRGGGFAGLVTTTTLDTDELPEAQRAELHSSVHRATLEPDDEPRTPAQPDRFDYEVVIMDGGTRRSMRVRERDASTALKELIALVEQAPQRRQQTRPPA